MDIDVLLVNPSLSALDAFVEARSEVDGHLSHKREVFIAQSNSDRMGTVFGTASPRAGQKHAAHHGWRTPPRTRDNAGELRRPTAPTAPTVGIAMTIPDGA
jgi:hypothetical protein